MRNIKFTLLFVGFGYAANAQFSIQPQIGLENSKTTIQYNNQSFVPLGTQLIPRVALRMDYKFKQGHGIFAGISTSSPAVDFKFADPQTAATSYKASKQNTKLRLEGGYQFSTKPIYFSKPGKSSGKSSFSSSLKSSQKCGGREQQSCREKMSCGQRSVMSRCSKNSNKVTAKNNGSYMRIIPSVGVAYIPSQPSEIVATQSNYSYKAGAWNTALIAGTGFEFGSNRHAKFIININYLKGLGNMDTKTINSVSNNKAVATMISSKASSWGVSLGIPFSLSKKKPQLHNQFERLKYSGRCGQSEKSQSRSRCGEYKMFKQ